MHGKVCVWVTICLLSAGCFREVSSLGVAEEQPGLAGLVVQDALGTAWPKDAVPRVPHLTIELDGPASPSRTPLFLVRGEPEEALLDDLAHPPLRAESERQLIALEVDTADAALGLLRAKPVAPLSPGARYALIWAAAPEPEVTSLQVSQSPSAGASLAQAWPASGQRDVPPNLPRLLLRFDGYLSNVPHAHLRDAEAATEQLTQAHLQPCGELGLPEGHCVWFTLAAPLASRRRYALRLDTPLHDAAGEVLSPDELTFETADGADETAPHLLPEPCALDARDQDGVCLLLGETALELRVRADEPVLAELLAPPLRAAALGFTEAIALRLEGIARQSCAFLRLTDLAGHRSEQPVCFELPADLPTLTIDEVRADPLGPEPAQEYVELLNFGPHPVDMAGFWLSDDAHAQGIRIDSHVRVEPGQRVLLVGPEFDRNAPQDGPLPDVLKLLRLGRSLALPNDGVRLFLRDGSGRRVSAAPALAGQREGQCIGRVGTDLRGGAERDFAPDPSGGCSPGSATARAATRP